MSGRIRSLKPEWIEDEPLVACSSDARVLSAALIVLADDYGNGRAGELYLSSRVFPGQSPEVLRKALEALIAIRYVLLYEVEGQRYFAVRNWKKHQKVSHPGKPIVPAYTGTTEILSRPSGDPPESLTPDRDRRPGPTTTTSAVAVAPENEQPTEPEPVEDGPVRCPVPMPLDDQDFAALELNVQLPRKVAETWLVSWAADQRAAGELRHVETWVRWALKALRGEWSDASKKTAMRAAANPPTESGAPPEPEVKTYADVLAARSRGAA